MSELEVTGPSLRLRYAADEDTEVLFELASDPAVTRWFSWGPYDVPAEAEAYVHSLPAQREEGTVLDFVIEHQTAGVVGVTGLSELARRDRRATVGTWFGREHWGSGMNVEAKALIAELAFAHLGLDRLTAWSNARNGRSQRALERAGFRREGLLHAWHRHGDQLHDVVVFGLTRTAWEGSALREIPVTVSGKPPAAFVLARPAGPPMRSRVPRGRFRRPPTVR